ncbi:hypothetical protein [Pseudoclavibacter helvolus]|uniref:hypothetical protein n=1 Tax=Pseudoclavibacter helvolus TaxID=255205 RepID=UPI003C726E50
MTQNRTEHRDTTGTTTRRRALQAAAWTVPVIAMTSATPLATASSPCPNVSNSANWSMQVNGPLRSGFQPQWQNQFGGTEIPLASDNASSFLSIQDRIGPTGSGISNVLLETTFVPVAGTLYSFSFRARTNNNLPGVQRLAITINSASQWNGATKPGVEPVAMSSAEATYSFTWTAPSNDPATLRYIFRIPADPDNVDDIRIRLPIITASSCG